VLRIHVLTLYNARHRMLKMLYPNSEIFLRLTCTVFASLMMALMSRNM